MSPSLPRIRRSARAFARAPALSIALLLTIALGVGSNAAVYGFLQGLTHPALPASATDRVVSILRQDRSRDGGPLSPNEYQQLRKSDSGFEWVAAVRIKLADTHINHHPETATVAATTPQLAAALTLPLDNDEVVISHRIWENDFDGKTNAIESRVRIDNADFRISGIAPEHLEGVYSDQRVDLWIQLNEQDLESRDRDRRDLWVLARLRRGVSIAQAQKALRAASAGLGETTVIPFSGLAPNTAHGLARVELCLEFSAAAVFFIACINVASFLLGRALRRSHETSLCIALGATRSELLRELFSDSVVISFAGGAVGLLLGFLTARALPDFLFKEDAERLTFAPHFLPILTAALVCIAVTVVCGMMPVLGTVTDRPWLVLQRETGSPSKPIQRLRSALVIGQITACCMLVVCTASLVDGLHSASKTNAGARLGNPALLTVQAKPRPEGPEIDVNYFTEVEQSAKSVPGLLPLAWTARLPGNQPTWRIFEIQPVSEPYRNISMDLSWLTPDSVQLLHPIAGRIFALNDQEQRVAIVNEEAAAELFGAQTAGVAIRDSSDLPIEIIGVVKTNSNDAKAQARPTIYTGYLNQAETPAPIRNAQFRVPLKPPAGDIELSANVVSANYFAALGMSLISGQTFPGQRIPGRGRVAVINQEAADLYFRGKPIGAAVIDNSGVRTEVIGVVTSQVFGTFEHHAEPTIYFPMWQDCLPRMTLILKHAKWNHAIAADLRNRAENVAGGEPVPVPNTLDSQLAQSSLAALRIATMIGSASAVTALMLSILGLLSAQSDAERQRRRDRTLRIALGAQRWRIILLVMKHAGWLTLVGTVIGTSLSFALLRLLLSDIAAISSLPIQVWLIAPLLPAVAIMIASLVPAQRASVISPAAILRDI